MNIKLPDSSRVLLISISNMANFDILSSFEDFDSVSYFLGKDSFSPEIRKPYKPYYSDLYKSMNFIENMQSGFYYITFALIMKLVIWILRYFYKYRRHATLYWMIEKLENFFSRAFYL
jgi:hypothetical protein